MGGLVGGFINHVLVDGMTAIERAYPMPKRLGTPLATASRATAKADPIVLVGGFANAPSGWDEWVRSLTADGFDVHVFDAPTHGLGDMPTAGKLLANYMDSVKVTTGHDKMDVIGFSEGGLLARMAVGELGRANEVDRLIGLASPNGGISLLHGTYDTWTNLARRVDEALPAYGQLLSGSKVLDDVAKGDAGLRAAKQGVRYASVYSQSTDNMVTAQSAHLDGAVNVPVAPDHPFQGDPNHFVMFHTSDRAYSAARELLLDHPDANAVAIGQSGKP